MAKKEYKLDIFDLLGAIDRRDTGYLSRQPADAQKAFTPTVALRWASSVSGASAADYLMLVNEVANLDFYALSDHPELQYKLLAVCGNGKTQRHTWIPLQKSGTQATKVHAFVAKYYPLASLSEIEYVVSQFTRESFLQFLNSSGCDPDEHKEVLTAYDKKTGSKKTKS
jgi:hypothetical protein